MLDNETRKKINQTVDNLLSLGYVQEKIQIVLCLDLISRTGGGVKVKEGRGPGLTQMTDTKKANRLLFPVEFTLMKVFHWMGVDLLAGREVGIWTCKLCVLMIGDWRQVPDDGRRPFRRYVLWREALSRPRYAPVKNMGQQVPRSKIFGARTTRPARTGTGTDGVDNKKEKTASWGEQGDRGLGDEGGRANQAGQAGKVYRHEHGHGHGWCKCKVKS